MGLSVRDWMIIVGVLLVLAVLLDGYRRMRQEWRSQLRVSLSRSSPEEREAAEWELVSSELPNGGARVVGRSHRGDQGEGVAARIEPRLSPLDPSATPVEAMESEPADRSEPDSPPPQESDLSPAEPAPAADALVPNDQPSPASDLPEQGEAFSAVADEAAAPAAPAPEEASGPTVLKSDQAPQLGPADEVVVINVVAREAAFAGEQLVRIFTACDLRFGRPGIFHRYERAHAQGALQFSVVNAVEPGVFDLERIESFSTQGVSFFLALPGPEQPMEAFDAMLETAQVVARNLNGELRDEVHSVMTIQTLEHCRARIHEFERRRLTRQHL